MKQNTNLKIRIGLLFMFIIILLNSTSNCLGQNPSLQILKRKCTYDTKFIGEKIIILYHEDSINLVSSNEYWLNGFIDLPDTVKFFFIEKLLNYENDTALCCMNVITRSFNGIEGCGGTPKYVARYTIQVDALYMINRLCWPGSMEFYSCSPVLYDNKLKKEINSDPRKIKCVFKEYKKWYEECKLKGKIPKYFPFNDSRYVWYGGRKSLSPK